MLTVIPNNLIDDLYLHKYNAANKMRQVMSLTQKYDGKMVKTASSGTVSKLDLITLFSNMLSALNMTANETDMKEIINKIAIESGNIDKQASTKTGNRERRDDIKIVSKKIKDSHYQVDISKDVVKQNGKEVLMISCYARDAYLGRYLIKRNFFYTPDREKHADNAYDEILTKISAIKDRYYNEIIDVSGIFTQMKQVLDGVISEIKIEEDSLGTNIKR
jgi:hypothetical protein